MAPLQLTPRYPDVVSVQAHPPVLHALPQSERPTWWVTIAVPSTTFGVPKYCDGHPAMPARGLGVVSWTDGGFPVAAEVGPKVIGLRVIVVLQLP